ncbi:MAG: hypothetical protein Ct9H300mP14_08920 [Gammaproteobacteria bacterium]|nr:MAG: hypothetical protein Ct9H300mP14_08920 [Gammaproteobacteria bacterium]
MLNWGYGSKINLLVGRELQKQYGLEPQIVLTVPLLEGPRWCSEDVQVAGKFRGDYRVAG